MEILNSFWLRPSIFMAIFVSMSLWEIFAPKRVLKKSKKKRWFSNLSIALFNTSLLKVLGPFTLASIALKSQETQIGLLHLVEMPKILKIIFSLVTLDFFIYLQHVATHKISFLWKFHKVHHADVDIDVTTGSRFHTIEIILSYLYKSVIIILIAPPVESVVFFEIILNSMAMFNHSNINLSLDLDRVLRKFIVTPDMHRVHHSVKYEEHNKNFGFNLCIWDYLFKTYQAKPAAGQLKMKTGLRHFRSSRYITPFALLEMPFLREENH